ncbi:unnamed protein product [Alopecurus aequalis]
MALRTLAAKMRLPASAAAPRLLSAPRVPPPSAPRARPFCASPSTGTQSKVARDWYLTQRERYDDLMKEFTNLTRVVKWTGKLDRFLRRSYLVFAPLATAGVISGWIDHYHKDAVISGLIDHHKDVE